MGKKGKNVRKKKKVKPIENKTRISNGNYKEKKKK
jgi:hypothetical protein